MALKCWLDWDGNLTIVRVRGEIDVSTSGRFSRCLQTALMDSRADLVLDLSEVTFIDAHGLGMLERFFQDCEDRGRKFSLTHVSPFIRRLLKVVGFDRVLPILDSNSGLPNGGLAPRVARGKDPTDPP